MNSWLNSRSYEKHEARVRVLGWIFVLSMLFISGGGAAADMFISSGYIFGQQCAAYAMALGMVLFVTLLPAGAGEFVFIMLARRKLET